MMRSVAVAFAVALALACASEAQQPKPHKSKEELQSHLQGIKGERKAIVHQLKQTKKTVRKVKGDISELDGRRSQLEDEYEKTKRDLAVGKKRQAIVQLELKTATQRLNRKREEMRHRLKLMYMRGNADIVAALAGAHNIGQFASRKYVFERVARKDRELFEEVKALCAYVAERKRRADNMVVEVANLKRKQEAQHAELTQVIGQKSELLNGLRLRQRELERIEAELRAEEAEIEAQIRAYNQSGAAKLPAFKGRFLRPVNGPITSGFGMRMHPILRYRRMHTGVDISAPNGTPILAAADGVVISAGYGRGYGNRVILDHGGGVSTIYAHASRLFVVAGQHVKRGQRIAAVGSTGLSTGNHLHWEVRINGAPVNPLRR